MKIMLESKNFDPNICHYITNKGKIGGPILKNDMDKILKSFSLLRTTEKKEISSSEMESVLSQSRFLDKAKVRTLVKPTNGGYITIISLLVSIGGIGLAVATFKILSSILGVWYFYGI